MKLYHIIISLFYNNYDLYSFKFNKLFFNIGILIIANTIFYIDKYIDQIYENKINRTDRFIHYIFSILITMGFNIVINLLLNIQNTLIKIQKENEINTRRNLYNTMKIKIIIYYIFGGIIFSFAFCYVSSFCIIFYYSQINLFIDIILGFLLLLFIPVIFFFVTSICRRISIKYDFPILYQISEFMELSRFLF